MLEVGILYEDGAQVWKSINDLADFRKDGVLTITITSERGNRRALAARMWSYQNNDIVAARNRPWWGEDNYVIGIMPNGTFFTTQWADGDELLYARSTETGDRVGTINRPITYPPQATVYNFIGAYLEPVEWERALAVFEAEMY